MILGPLSARRLRIRPRGLPLACILFISSRVDVLPRPAPLGEGSAGAQSSPGPRHSSDRQQPAPGIQFQVLA
ncbi:hypothetical protein BDZ90DRAFT_110524 [Jaminaea rosea]|uniref:Uncharacterized protein n=1 Tax=Jaminaea rosea TaxID=1569628 RepID=A0A316UVZ8_9BASI|nr:hypothetical protein BDZ90DRAFT_110524 [Jaminaea rosea]PWN29470.1 hypothetical protein BDZ90DRAFT_110524 [Jaminaea rosea]